MKLRAPRWVKTVVPPVIVFVVVTGALEAFVRVREVKVYLLPTPSAVFYALYDDRANLLASLWTTTQAALVAFVGSAVVGILAGLILSASSLVRRAVYPYSVFFQTVPVIAIAPALVYWLNYGLPAVAVSAFVVSLFPVIANTLTGLTSADPALVDLFRLYGGGRVAALFKLRIPSALPDIFTGLRISAGLAVIGTVVSEFLVGELGARAGLGVRIVSDTRHYGRTDRAFAAVLLTCLLGLALFALVNLCAHRLLRHWHASEQPTPAAA